jgi:putative FmdB family regulatory protein
MPTYEYECKTCGHTFDVFQSMRDEPLKICPECGKELRRLINGGTGIIFKGSGFYVTDAKGGSGTISGGSNASKGSNASVGSNAPAQGEKAAADTAKPAGTAPAKPSAPEKTPAAKG